MANPHQQALAKAVPLERVIAERGIKLRGRGAERVGPCPICQMGRDRFSINTRKAVWNCRGCQVGGDVIELVKYLDNTTFCQAVAILAGEQPSARPRTVTPTAPIAKSNPPIDEEAMHRRAAWLWSQRRPITGTSAEKYLRDVRGFTGTIQPTLAFLPPGIGYSQPALIAAFAIPEEPEPGILAPPVDVRSVHVILLNTDGTKAAIDKPKRTTGRPLGNPIVVAPPNDLLGLAICEGIENALSAHLATGLGAWAACSAMYLPKLTKKVPDYIEAVTIFADEDQVGKAKAHELALALVDRGIDVHVRDLYWTKTTLVASSEDELRDYLEGHSLGKD